jgi:hypothetical protein
MYDIADTYPVEPLPTANASMGVNSEREITATRNAMLDRAETEDVSKEASRTLVKRDWSFAMFT